MIPLYRPPRRAFGERPYVAPVDETMFRAVVYLCEAREIAEATQSVPVGTGFIVAVDQEGVTLGQIVTARHVIENTSAVSVRLNTDAGTRDIPTEREDWYVSETADVAALPLFGPKSPLLRHRVQWSQAYVAIGFGLFVDADYVYRGPALLGAVQPGVHVGADLAYVGLFHLSPGQDEGLSGTLCIWRDLTDALRGEEDDHAVGFTED